MSHAHPTLKYPYYNSTFCTIVMKTGRLRKSWVWLEVERELGYNLQGFFLNCSKGFSNVLGFKVHMEDYFLIFLNSLISLDSGYSAPRFLGFLGNSISTNFITTI